MFTDQPVQTRARRLLLSGQAVSRRHRTAARWILAACLAFIAVAAMFLVAPEWLTAGRPPLIALVFAVSLGLMVDLYLEGRATDRELRSTRVGLLDARDHERLRIQRDLHDSAQQRLVSVRVHLGLLAEGSDRSADRASIDQLGQELDTALAEIGAVTRNEYPQMLSLRGLAPSLRSATKRSPIPVSVDAEGFGRYPESIERNVYFCCLEALQNVVKHGGSTAKARIRLFGTATSVVFEVEDSGVGFDPARIKHGDGLDNLADRVASMRGRFSIDSRPGMGTRIRGEIPVQS
jgi:two-component system, NarL family, sensor kinase